MSPARSESAALEQLRRAGSSKGRRISGTYRIEGTRLHERGLRAGAPILLSVFGRDWAGSSSERERKLLGELERSGCELIAVPDEAVRELTEGRTEGAIVGLVTIPAPRTLAELVSHEEAPSVLLVGVALDDPGNVGALIRTGLAMGVRGFVAVGGTDPFHPKSVRTSRGSLFRLPLAREESTEGLLDRLAALGVDRRAAVSHEGDPLQESRFAGPTAILIGNEATGLDASVLARVDGRVTVPMTGPIDSVSVNAAAAMILWEIRRRALVTG